MMARKRIETENVTGPDGRHGRIVRWPDGELLAVPKSLHPRLAGVAAAFVLAIYGGLVFFWPNAKDTQEGVLKIALIFAALWAAIAFARWLRGRPKWRGREVAFWSDGQITFPKSRPRERRGTWYRRLFDKMRKRDESPVQIKDVSVFEYSETKQWTNLPRYYAAVEWWDVYATLRNGRRVLFARTILDRQWCHELALELGDALRLFQQEDEPTPTAHAPLRRIID